MNALRRREGKRETAYKKMSDKQGRNNCLMKDLNRQCLDL